MDKIGKKNKKLIVICVLAVFLLGMSIWIGVLISQNASLNSELEQKQNELAVLQEENNALEALVDEENETALMEEYARKSGYVYADERVYIEE